MYIGKINITISTLFLVGVDVENATLLRLFKYFEHDKLFTIQFVPLSVNPRKNLPGTYDDIYE